jgi:hypothetical protein
VRFDDQRAELEGYVNGAAPVLVQAVFVRAPDSTLAREKPSLSGKLSRAHEMNTANGLGKPHRRDRAPVSKTVTGR